MASSWVVWVQKLRAIAQVGLTYSESPYDRERYQQIREIAAEIAATQTDTDLDIIQGLFEDNPDYPTPKVDIRGAVFEDDKILLIKESANALWALPGGWADIGDSPAEAVEREVREESGIVAKATKLAAVYDRNRHAHEPYPTHIYKLFFLCEMMGGDLKPGHDILDAGWFALDNLPTLSTNRVTEYQIRRMYEHNQNQMLRTDFD